MRRIPIRQHVTGRSTELHGLGVSLRLQSSAESWRTGFYINDFYTDAMISPDGMSRYSRYIALGIPGARSFYTDRLGRVHYSKR